MTTKQTTRIVRIRKHTARKGGRHYYWHADIRTTSVAEAIDAAVEGRIKRWRCVDDFNPGQPESFEFFEVLYED